MVGYRRHIDINQWQHQLQSKAVQLLVKMLVIVSDRSGNTGPFLLDEK